MGLEREGIIGGIIDFFIEDYETAIEDPSIENIAIAAATTIKPVKVVQKLYKGAKALRRTPKKARTCCFVAGTLVDTETGLRAIETVEVGDKVWARDEATGETALKAVTDLIQRHDRVIWEVTLRGPNGEAESFETTDDHPWWIAGQGWKKTEELGAGLAVGTRDGRGMVLVSVVETDRTDATYNLTVADFETYFVGEQRVLVHNCNRKGGGKTGRKLNENKAKAAQKRLDAAKADRDRLQATPNKTKADKAALKKAEGAIKKAREDFKKSEPHGIRGQGQK